jgi:hypothetical protein
VGHPCSIPGLGRGGRVADEPARRRPAAVAARGLCSGETVANACWPAARALSVGTCRGEGGLTGCGEVQRRKLGRGRTWRRGGGALPARRGGGPLNRQWRDGRASKPSS